MSDFVERLPWRLAALAGLLVGAASLLGGTDLWVTLVRVGAAFVVFGLLGWVLRNLLQTDPTRSAARTTTAAPQAGAEARPGTHVDQTTPEMSVDDLKSSEGSGAVPHTGDEPRR